MDRDAVVRIEALQPYDARQGPQFFALRRLRDLSNRDKHQVVNIVVSGLGLVSPDIKLVDGHAEGVSLNHNITEGALEVGDWIARFFVAPGGHPDVRFDIEYGLYAALPDGTEPLEHILVGIALTVDGVVNEFGARFFS